VNRRLRRWHEREQRKVQARLEPLIGGCKTRGDGSRPEFRTGRLSFDSSDRIRAMPYGGLGVMHDLAHEVGLVRTLDERVQVLKQHRPYFESDHILNLAYNALCGGRVLEDIEVRRNDLTFLDALGARAIPDPTTAGDFCRRFDAGGVEELMDAVNEVRLGVWQRQPASFFQETARIDADGTFVTTEGECKQGMDISYKGDWGYHPLLVSLANTQEPLFIKNRSGNRPSSEGAAAYLDRAIALCRRAGFKDILLRGDTDFSQTQHLDRWHEDGVRFVFGYSAHQNLVQDAEDLLDDEDYGRLVRRANQVFEGVKCRAKPPRVKQQIIEQRGYKNLQTIQEDVAEFPYSPHFTKRDYRVVVLRKLILETEGQCSMLDYRYFFYITNDEQLSAEEVVRESNQRCNQENLNEQLKNGPRAFRAPLDSLEANWAYAVIVSLAWSLKAWFALLMPVWGRWRDRHLADKERVLRMDFRTFVQTFILIPVQVVRTGRRLVYRLLAWRPQVPQLLRVADALRG